MKLHTKLSYPIRWFKSLIVSTASERQQRKLAKDIIGDDREVLSLFPLKGAGRKSGKSPSSIGPI